MAIVGIMILGFVFNISFSLGDQQQATTDELILVKEKVSIPFAVEFAKESLNELRYNIQTTGNDSSGTRSSRSSITYSQDPNDLEPLKGTVWKFAYTILFTTKTDTLTFGNNVETDSAGDVRLVCTTEYGKGSVYYTNVGFAAIIKSDNLYEFYIFNINNNEATGKYSSKVESTGIYSNEYSLTGKKSDGCSDISDTMTLDIPCAEFAGNSYHMVFDIYTNPDDPDGLYFQLNDINISEATSSCALIDSSLNIDNVPCVVLDGVEYTTLLLEYYPNSLDSEWYYWKVSEAKKNNLTPYKPSEWSDKIVVSKTTGTTTDSTPLYTTDTLYIDLAVENNGTSTVSKTFNITLYVDGKENKSWSKTSLTTTAYASVIDYSIGNLSAGTHNIKIKVDSTNVVSETNENDNEYTKTIIIIKPSTVNLLPYKPSGWSDKIVVATTTGTTTDSPSFYSSKTLYVSFAMENDGTSTVSTPFNTTLYVDGVEKKSWSKTSLNTTDYGAATDYSIGKLSGGTHKIKIKVDSTNVISETNESDNEYTKTITVKTLPF